MFASINNQTSDKLAILSSLTIYYTNEYFNENFEEIILLFSGRKNNRKFYGIKFYIAVAV